MVKQRRPEGMRLARLLMVLSSISPLFILWGIRGNNLVPDSYFLSFCGFMVIVPNLFLLLRVYTVHKLKETRELVVGTAEDHREHLLVYLFAMLLPVYGATIETYRDLAAALAALGFIVFLFWHLNLHYMNIIFAIFGYRIFTVYPPEDNNPLTSKVSQVLITRRTLVLPDDCLVVYGLSDTVTMEIDK